MNEVTLEARGLTKQYPGTLALNRVDIQIRRGSVRALIGENGAGKSTLVKILAGVEQPSDGQLLLDGVEVSLPSVRAATAKGIGIIHQELSLCPNLSVADNIFLGHELTRGVLLDRRTQHKQTIEILQRLEHPIDPDCLVGELALGQQQIVEIARALAQEVRVLMMDEPTSALSATEIDTLFRLIRELKSRGVAIIYISHRLRELLEISDEITVLRDGCVAGDSPVGEIDSRWIVGRMTGRTHEPVKRAASAANDKVILRAESLSLRNSSGRPVLNDVSFSLHAGEILGIYGLMGAGRTELLEGLMALHPDLAGSIWLDSTLMNSAGTTQRIESGMAMVPEDRQTSGLVSSFSVRANMTLAGLDHFCSGAVLSDEKENTATQAMVSDLRIKSPGLGASIQSLSGGNQQKVVIAKCLLTSPKVLLLDEPTRGVDVAAKADIYAIVRGLAADGMGIVYVSSELEEISAISERVLVMSRGAVAGEFSGDEITDDALTTAASVC